MKDLWRKTWELFRMHPILIPFHFGQDKEP